MTIQLELLQQEQLQQVLHQLELLQQGRLQLVLLQQVLLQQVLPQLEPHQLVVSKEETNILWQDLYTIHCLKLLKQISN